MAGLPGYFRPPGFDAPLVPTPEQRRAVRAVMGQVAGEIAQLDDRAMRAVLPALVEAREELRAGLLQWLQEAPDGDLRFTAQAMRNALANIEGAFVVIRERLGVDMLGALEGFGAEAGRLSIANLEFELARFSGVFGQSLRPTQLRTAAILAEGNKMLVPRYRSSAARYAGNVIKDIRRQLAVGVAKGETFHQLTNRLVRLGGPKGYVATRGVAGDPEAIVEHISEGLFQRYRAWADRLVRTEMLHAYNVQHLEGIHQANESEPDSPYLKRWDSTLDRRVCPICSGLDGKTVGVDESFPGGYDHPPAHPYCRCVLVAWRKEWGEFADEPGSEEEPKQEPEQEPTEPTQLSLPSEHQDATLRGLEKSYRAGGWTGAREAIDNDLRETGLSQTDSFDSTKLMVRKLKDGFLGYHEVATIPGSTQKGRIVISKYVAERARDFAALWRSDANAVRAAMAAVEPLTVALQGALAKGDFAGARDLTKRLAAHPSSRHLGGAHALRTLYHEAIHGFGPGLPFAYAGAGKVAEEVATEVLARREIMRRFAVPRSFYARGHSYHWMIDPLTAKVAELYEVEWDDARSIIERAADRFKRLEERTNSPERAIELFSQQFEKPSNKDIGRERSDLLDSTGRAQTPLARALQGEVLRIWRVRPR